MAMKVQGGRMVPAGGDAKTMLKAQNQKLEKLLTEINRFSGKDELRDVAVQSNDRELYEAVSLLSRLQEIIRKKTFESRR